MKKKFTNILNKIKENKKRILQVLIGALTVFIFTFTVYNMNNPTKLNRLFASIGSVPNEAFEDSDFYSCIIDTYNNEHQDNQKAYTDSLTDEELASITSLSCNGKHIESTKGLEKLTELISLNLNNNQLASIDLSNNTKLKQIYLGNDSITELDLTNNIELTNLYLRHLELLSLDLRNNLKLSSLKVEESDLETINLGNNTALITLNLGGNQLTSVDLSNKVQLTDLDLGDNCLTNIDLSNNTKLTELNLSGNYLTSVDISNNPLLTSFRLSESKLTNIDLSNNTLLEYLDLSNNSFTEIDLNSNPLLEDLFLSDNQLTSLDLSNNSKLLYLDIKGTPLIEDILMQNGDTYTIEEKIIPPSGQSFSYSIDDTSIASISGNTITALQEGSTTLRTSFGNISFEKKLVIGEVKLAPATYANIKINEKEKYIYFKENDFYIINDAVELKYYLNPNVGNVVVEDNMIKVVVGDKIYLEYKMVYFDGGALGTDDSGDYSVVVSSTEEPTKYNIKAVNCTYEFANDGKEVIIKYNDNEIDRKKIVYMYLPKDYKISPYLLYFGNNILDDSIINNIDDVSKIDKNKVNILNAKMTYKTDDGNYFDIENGDESVSEYYPMYINSNNYDLTKEYIYLGTNNFNNDIQIYDNEHEKDKYTNSIVYDDRIEISEDEIIYHSWNLIKVSSDKYDMSGDVIDLKGTELDISKINVTNANLKVDNNKLLVMYNDEVVKEFKLENGKKEDTTTKPSSEEKTTTTKVTTKQEVKTTTKKKSIINKIFGKSGTTTKTTTKKSIVISKKNTSKDTTKVIDNTNKATSNSVNKKIIYQDNILLILSICLMFALSTCLIVVYRKSKENN